MSCVIGVTLAFDSQGAERFTLRQDYVRSLGKAGALCIALPATSPADVGAMLDRVGGLVLTGGSDVDPPLYGAEPHPRLGAVFRERDEFEIALCQEAFRRDLPILAICRGQQVLNVAMGGTLIQDITSDLAGAIDHDPGGDRWVLTHEVEVAPGSRLGAILGRERAAVNSIHHQAVGELGKGLVASARCVEDGIVEAIEAPDRRFALGVQWHPEAFFNRQPDFEGLFSSLVAESKR